MPAVKTSNRIEYLDIARGLGMLAVICGHVQLSARSIVLCNAFDIPMFFFLSGMMYRREKNQSFKQLFIRLCRKLLIPYLVFSVATWCLYMLPYVYLAFKYGGFGINVKTCIFGLMQTFVAQGSTGYLVHNAPLWFVTGLFVVNVLYYFSAKFNDKAIICIGIAAAVLGHWMVNSDIGIDFTRLPWNIEAACSGLLFFASGNIAAERFGRQWLGKFCEKSKTAAVSLMIVCLMLFVPLALWNGMVSLASNELGRSTIMLYLVAYCGIMAVLLGSVFISHLPKNFIVSAVRWIGEHSFLFMAIHMPVKQYIELILSKILRIIGLPAELLNESPALHFAVFVLVLIGTGAAVQIIQRCRSKRNSRTVMV